MDSEILLAALDALPEALIVWHPASRRATYANRPARTDALVIEDALVSPDLAACAAEQSDARRRWQRHGCDAPAHRLLRGDRAFWVRTAALPNGLELLVCRRERMRERELVERVRTAYALTDRQADVLLHLLRGAKNDEIARSLGVAYATVRRHLGDLQAALGVPNRIGVFRAVQALREPAEFSSGPADQNEHARTHLRIRK